MSNKECLILFLIDKHPRLNNIYGLTQIFDRAEFPGNVSECLNFLKDSELIEINRNNSPEMLPIYKLTSNGKTYLKSEFNGNNILNFIKTMRNPKFLYELTELILKKH
jgi:DNA-binding PadR family transcriptional regulator